MSDWLGGYGGKRPANAKIPVKIHRNVSMIRTSDPLLADELLSRAKLGRLIVGRGHDSAEDTRAAGRSRAAPSTASDSRGPSHCRSFAGCWSKR